MSTFTPLTDAERDELTRLIASGQPLPEPWRGRLFPDSPHAVEIGKEYQLVYEGKARREEVLAETPAAPWQLVRRFCADRPFEDGWRNLLVWGDNLLALRELLADQRGPDRLGTRGKIKLIYIDPPFATRQDFMKDKEKAYQDKVLGSQFIEFLLADGQQEGINFDELGIQDVVDKCAGEMELVERHGSRRFLWSPDLSGVWRQRQTVAEETSYLATRWGRVSTRTKAD